VASGSNDTLRSRARRMLVPRLWTEEAGRSDFKKSLTAKPTTSLNRVHSRHLYQRQRTSVPYKGSGTSPASWCVYRHITSMYRITHQAIGRRVIFFSLSTLCPKVLSSKSPESSQRTSVHVESLLTRYETQDVEGKGRSWGQSSHSPAVIA